MFVVNWPIKDGDIDYVWKQTIMKINHNIRSSELEAVSLSGNLP